VVVVTVIQQKELRNQIGDVLRRVEAGEIMIVTVSGRQVAELSPAHRRRWISGDALSSVWRGPTPRDLERDLEQLPAGLVDPFAQ
jgi:prevent-host-death family protein